MRGSMRIEAEERAAAQRKSRETRAEPAVPVPDLATPSRPLTTAGLLHLQETAGNVGVTRLVATESVSQGTRAMQRQTAEEEEAAKAASSPLLSMRGGEKASEAPAAAETGGLLTGEAPLLDPSITARLSSIEQRLSPASVSSALAGVPLSLAGPPAFLPPARPALGPLEGSATAPPPRREAGPGTLGDALDAVGALPSVERLIRVVKASALERFKRDSSRLGKGEKAAVITTMALIVLPTAAAAMADKPSRDFILGQLDGRTFNVPGVDGLSVTLKTQGKDLGVTAMFDLTPYINW